MAIGKKKKQAPKESKHGPKPETLKVEGDRRKAIKKSLGKKKPMERWPK